MSIVAQKENGHISGSVTQKGGEMMYVGANKTPMYRFSVCYWNKQTPDGKWDTRYITCKTFGNRALKMPTINGGDDVFCSGEIKKNTFKGRDGKEKESLEMICDFVLLGSTGNQRVNAPHGFQEVDNSEMDGDLPF